MKFWRVKSYDFDKISLKLTNMSKVGSFLFFFLISPLSWFLTIGGNLETSWSHSLGDILVGRRFMGPWDGERLSNGLYLAELEVSFVVWIKKDPYPYPCLFSQIVLSIWKTNSSSRYFFDSPVHLLRFHLYYLTITHCDAHILTWQTVNSDLSFFKLSIKRYSTRFIWKLTNHTKMAYYRLPGAWWLNQRNHVSEVSYS